MIFQVVLIPNEHIPKFFGDTYSLIKTSKCHNGQHHEKTMKLPSKYITRQKILLTWYGNLRTISVRRWGKAANTSWAWPFTYWRKKKGDISGGTERGLGFNKPAPITVPLCSLEETLQYSNRAFSRAKQWSIAPERTRQLAVACGITLELSQLGRAPDLLRDIMTPASRWVNLLR